jgi:hypothetical protein
MSKSGTLLSGEIGYILELGYCESEFSDLIVMEYIMELSDTKYECYSRSQSSTLEHLTIERGKSCTSTDEAL